MSDDGGIRLVLEQEGPYAFKVSFDGTALEARSHRIARPGACFALRAPQPAQTSTA